MNIITLYSEYKKNRFNIFETNQKSLVDRVFNSSELEHLEVMLFLLESLIFISLVLFLLFVPIESFFLPFVIFFGLVTYLIIT